MAADQRVHAAVDQLLQACQHALTADELVVAQLQRDLLVTKQLVSPDMIRMLSLEQLVSFGLSPGGAAALKKTFPTAAGAATGVIDDIARLLRPMQQLVVAVYDNQHLPTQSQASSANQRLRHQVLAAYSANSDSGQETWCVVTGLWWPSLARAGCPYVRAAHIMGRATPAIDWAAMDLGPSPDVLPNVVPMMTGVERAFDSYRMCAVPSTDAVTEDVSFEIHILDPALMTQPVYQEFAGRFKQDYEQWTHPSSRKQQRLGLGDLQATELTFGQLHKQPLVFLGARRPARRCFTYHAFWALRHAAVRSWDAGGLVIDENHLGWLSPTFESRLHATALWARMQSVQALGAGSDGVSSAADEEAVAAGHH